MNKRVLNMVTSSKGDISFSNRLSKAVIEKLTNVYPEIEVQALTILVY